MASISNIGTTGPHNLSTVQQRATSRISQWTATARSWLTRSSKAHNESCTLDALPKDIRRDIGMSPEDATGIPSWQPDLPFFMQGGFRNH